MFYFLALLPPIPYWTESGYLIQAEPMRIFPRSLELRPNECSLQLGCLFFLSFFFFFNNFFLYGYGLYCCVGFYLVWHAFLLQCMDLLQCPFLLLSMGSRMQGL